MDLDVDAPFTVEPLEGQPDTVAFEYGFTPQGKALDDGTTADVVTELDNGDLLIEGYAAVFEGVDREGENFVEGAFQRGLKSFVDGQAALTYHHRNHLGIGRVLGLEEHAGKGLWMRARVDYQPESSPLRFIYNGVKRGTYSGLSTQGFFKRKLTGNGWRIADTDLTAISVTPVPVHPGTHFDVVAGKALSDIDVPSLPDIEEDEVRQGDLEALKYCVEQIGRVVDLINSRGNAKPRDTDVSAATL